MKNATSSRRAYEISARYRESVHINRRTSSASHAVVWIPARRVSGAPNSPRCATQEKSCALAADVVNGHKSRVLSLVIGPSSGASATNRKPAVQAIEGLSSCSASPSLPQLASELTLSLHPQTVVRTARSLSLSEAFTIHRRTISSNNTPTILPIQAISLNESNTTTNKNHKDKRHETQSA